MLKLTVKGTDFLNNPQQYLNDIVKERVSKTLAPFESEIRKEGGKVTFDLSKNVLIFSENFPKDLKRRIVDAFQG